MKYDLKFTMLHTFCQFAESVLKKSMLPATFTKQNKLLYSFSFGAKAPWQYFKIYVSFNKGFVGYFPMMEYQFFGIEYKSYDMNTEILF